jgi:hypothetical protein
VHALTLIGPHLNIPGIPRGWGRWRIGYRMLSQLWQSWQFNVWLGLASLAAGLAVISPCLLVPAWRRKLLRADLDIEGVGLIALVVALVAVGCYNYFGAGGGG